MKDKIKDRVIVALDINERQEFETMANSLKNKATFVKIGMECFYSLGPDSVKIAKDHGFKVFLDLKLHDIPNTVYKSVFSLTRLGADMLNVHALGGLEMMKAAKNAMDHALESGSSMTPPLLIAVTHLTSLDQKALQSELGVEKSLKESVKNLALLAKEAALDGCVSSAQEVELIKKACGQEFKTITPGIRLPASEKQDQKRVASPKEAFAAGTDYIVVGRNITQSEDPGKVFIQIIEEIS